MGTGDRASLEVVERVVLKSLGGRSDAFDASVDIAVGGQDELTKDAVAPLRGGGIEGDGIVTLFGDVKLEGLLLRAAEAVGGDIADVDVGRVFLTGDARAPCAAFDVQFHGAEVFHVPVANLVFQRVVTRGEAECRAAVGESVFCPTLMDFSVDVAEIESVAETFGRTRELEHAAT